MNEKKERMLARRETAFHNFPGSLVYLLNTFWQSQLKSILKTHLFFLPAPYYEAFLENSPLASCFESLWITFTFTNSKHLFFLLLLLLIYFQTKWNIGFVFLSQKHQNKNMHFQSQFIFYLFLFCRRWQVHMNCGIMPFLPLHMDKRGFTRG